jgi:predicted acetyltransferase
MLPRVTDDVRVRPAKKGEEKALARAFIRAFRVGEEAGLVEYFRDSPHLTPADTLVAEVDSAIAGQVSALRLRMSVLGKELPIRGYAAVGVAPEFRRRRVADRLMRASLERVRTEGDFLAGLYPFDASFYAKFGFARAEWVDVLEVPATELPASSLRRHVRRFDPERDTDGMRRVYDVWRKKMTGPLARSDYWWKVRVLGRIADGVVYVDPKRGDVGGYLLYAFSGEPARTASRLVVRELVARDSAAYRALVGFVEALGEQYRVITFPLPRGEGGPLLTGFGPPVGSSASLYYSVACSAMAGAMLRLVDVARAFARHPGVRRAPRGSVGLDLTDPVFPDQTGSFDVSGARLRRGAAARDRLALDVGRLAQIYFCAASAKMLLRQGLVAGSVRAAEALDARFAGPHPFLSPLNGF